MQSSKESARYLPFDGDQVYALGFGCAAPIAKVLLCGPFPSDRLHSLVSWGRWARFLAKHGILAVRFDYRGTGESTGKFSELTFDSWVNDVTKMADWMESNWPDCPLVLHGLGMGGLLAQKAFSSGHGRGLLMWSPAPNAREVLNQALILRLSMDMILLKPENRRSAKDYIAVLESGGEIEIDGYACSGAMWRGSDKLILDALYSKPGEGVESQTSRAWRHEKLAPHRAPLITSAAQLRAMNPRANVPKSPLNPDFSDWYRENVKWIEQQIVTPANTQHA